MAASELSKLKLEYEHTEEWPEIMKAIRRLRAKFRKKKS